MIKMAKLGKIETSRLPMFAQYTDLDTVINPPGLVSKSGLWTLVKSKFPPVYMFPSLNKATIELVVWVVTRRGRT